VCSTFNSALLGAALVTPSALAQLNDVSSATQIRLDSLAAEAQGFPLMCGICDVVSCFAREGKSKGQEKKEDKKLNDIKT
jgi:hypothetical protein